MEVTCVAVRTVVQTAKTHSIHQSFIHSLMSKLNTTASGSCLWVKNLP